MNISPRALALTIGAASVVSLAGGFALSRSLARAARPAAVPAAVQQAAPQLSKSPAASEPRHMTESEHASLVQAVFDAAGAPGPEAHAVEAKLRAAFARPEIAAGATLESLECRVQTCRGVVTFADVANDKRVFRSLFIEPETAVATGLTVVIPERETRSDGKIRGTLYLVPPNYLTAH